MEIVDYTKRVFDFYARLCPEARISIHIVSASYMHEGRVIRENEFTAKVVVIDPEDTEKTICVLASRDGHSPIGALMKLFDSYDGPIFSAMKSIDYIGSTYHDLFVIDLPKDGTREFALFREKIDELRVLIRKHNSQ